MSDTAFHIHGSDRTSRWLVMVDHATNRVPDWVNGGDLGLQAADMARHIAFDPGALGFALALGDALGATVVSSDFSRLVIDPNRGEDDPTLLMRLYDGSVIPANRAAGADERERRLDRLHRPYHRAVEALAARRSDTVLCSIHTFTPQLRGRPPRPWQVGILSSPRDTRLTSAVLRRLSRESDLTVGDNQPYTGDLPGDSIDRHGLAPGRPNVLVEIRNDLLPDAKAQRHWAGRIAPALTGGLAEAGL
ncbi:Predicted N-formylglutamate amidohydrolase [Wenxinia saemankumensis]|uniref:Predicted N-formylglutamate amidohydrolase n=1 Tax=Wenxinia saemankumensis TaxID=1447782 RepID=A0A1M6ECV0_9RHOB|nr:Predicted N-formylglutamate amidohydrolase [Wenxinia saemankumensis]